MPGKRSSRGGRHHHVEAASPRLVQQLLAQRRLQQVVGHPPRQIHLHQSKPTPPSQNPKPMPKVTFTRPPREDIENTKLSATNGLAKRARQSIICPRLAVATGQG